MLKTIFYKISKYLPHIFALLFVLAFTALAWTEPAVAPPGGNVSAPLNVGSTGQSKAGGLILGTNCVGSCVNGLIVDKGKVGIGTASPSEKLDVSGNIKTGGEFLTASNEGSCSIWKDCDNDTKTAGSGDCDESCSQCYVGSTASLGSPDGKDQNCNGQIDESMLGPNAWCNSVDRKYLESYYEEGCLHATVTQPCNQRCNAMGYPGGGTPFVSGSRWINVAGPPCDTAFWLSQDYSGYEGGWTQRNTCECKCIAYQ